MHKQSEEQLRAAGAVNEQDLVDLDTGAVIMDVRLTNALFGLISTDGWVDDAKFAEFVNDRARISFYGDFLYPLARQSTLEGYYKEKPEGSFCEELLNCRTKIWDALHDFELSLISLSPAEFIHFGTTWELRELMTRGVDDYEFLGWRRQSAAGCHAEGSFAAYNSLIGKDVVIGSGAYIENCVIDGSTVVGEGSILSNLRLAGVTVPADVVLHSLQLKDGQCVVRVYGVLDNPKGAYEQNTAFLGGTLRELMDRNQISPEELWGNQERYLWSADLYPVCADTEEAVTWALLLCRMARGEGSQEDVAAWKRQKRMSLYSSFNQADVRAMLPWRRQLEDRITVQRFVDQIAEGIYYKDALAVFGSGGISREQYSLLMEQSEKNSFSTRIRIYYDVSRYMKHTGSVFAGVCYDQLENRCFQEIQRAICESGKLPSLRGCRIGKDEAAVALPVRVNWGGGWTDTPPYCLERGGTVINASITLNGIYPVQVSIRKIDRLHVEFESADVKVSGAAESVEEIRDCRNPYDFFSLHKAALIATGIISDAETRSLQEILRDLGGGFRLSTQVVGVPKGSGLGTSSILAAACIKAIFAFVGCELADNDLYNLVLCMEQIMSTGGGWQDQVGGVVPGIKFITTKPGINQQFKVEPVILEDSTMRELQERFALIYTGQRRLARNLLRDVVGGYIGSRKEALEALDRLHQIAALIRFELERGSIDRFAQLLNEHWMLSQQLDSGSTNTCIDQIFLVCEDLIDGRFITGAGGGGFLQVILKKGVTKERLQARLYGIFQDSGVAVWDAEIV